MWECDFGFALEYVQKTLHIQLNYDVYDCRYHFNVVVFL